MAMVTTDASGSYFKRDYAGNRERVSICCRAFIEALETGSDNEGYGRLISVDDDKDWRIGGVMRSGRCCPWCGSYEPIMKGEPRIEAAPA